ncbi:MAG: exonuclease SbcCD subunit D C-terminal domain-containing protein [Gammaproteobacteria bacterium]|nr:exonuclease SbcCD subunit D C-terminal domain-containing protein [Gammaproteobacteria bacterium]
MRIIHTSDWHLGHQLLGISRQFEQQQFLDWLFEQLVQQKIDALLVAGDIFDSANPPAWAWQLLYRFLARVKQQLPQLDLVLVAGNHDSPSKLDAPDQLFKAFDIHLIGSLPRLENNQLDFDKLIVELTNKEGVVAARVAAVPFLRAGDLELGSFDDEVPDKLIAGVERIYQQLAAKITELNQPTQASIALGHAYMVSSQISEMSERRILGGNQHALPIDMLTQGYDYAGLGHLHRPQQLGGQAVYYCGSPIAMSLAEIDYKHQVKLLEFKDGELLRVDPLLVPRRVELIKVPATPLPLSQVLSLLEDLTVIDQPLEQQPLLEVLVLLEQPQAMLRDKIAEVIADKAVRLVKITTSYLNVSENNTNFPDEMLNQLEPEQVFSLKYQAQFNDKPPAKYTQAFSELLTSYQQQDH